MLLPIAHAIRLSKYLIPFLLSLMVTTAFAKAAEVRLAIDAGAAPQTLKEFTKQTQLQVLYRYEAVRDRETQAVHGSFEPTQALAKMLAGSGLVFDLINDRTIVVDTAHQAAASQERQSGAADAKVSLMSQSGHAETPEAEASSSGLGLASSDSEGIEEVVVTGSHIRGSQAASPSLTIDRDYIDRSGYQTAGDVVRSLPQSFSGGLNVAVVGAGGGRNSQSISGASTANLRGLGSESTLTLVNGHRLAYAEGVGAVDLSLIPLSAIERVEVVTDGASAIYGSDAVGGVVNFILRKSVEGINAGGAWGTSSDGGGMLQRYDVLAGHDWTGGRGLLSYEFTRQNPIDAGDRSYISNSVVGTSLLPYSKRNSTFLSVSQSIAPTLEVALQGLYARSDVNSAENLGPFLPGLFQTQRSTVDQYGVVVTASSHISDTWRASLSGDIAGNKVNAPVLLTLDGSPLPAGAGARTDTRLRSIELTGDGNLIALPTGSSKLALGVGYRQEEFTSATIPLVQPPVSGQRNVKHVFAEALFPIVASSSTRTGLNSLELSIAGRYEDYSDFGSSTNPKIGAIYSPMKDVLLRASWGRSFRAPTLLQEHSAETTYLQFLPDAGAPGSTSLALIRYGGNPLLDPEEASTYTVGLTVTPSVLPRSTFQLTYYDISYKQRIGSPFSNPFTALSNPYGLPYVTRNPGAALASSVAAGSVLVNESGLPFNPATVAAIVDNRYQNASHQSVSGIDSLANYAVATRAGQLSLSLNLTYLQFSQRLTELSPSQEISGTVFNPPKFRGRAGVGWQRLRWSASLFANYSGPSRDPTSIPANESIASWTTVDGQVSYEMESVGALPATRISVSSQNLLNRRPPFINASQSALPGINFDSTNASAVGRFVTAQISMSW